MNTLPLPDFAEESIANAGMVWQVPYQDRLDQAIAWRRKYDLPAAIKDGFKLCLMPIDCQVSFCIPPGTKIGPFTFGGELYVGGADGMGAVNDNIRLAKWIYKYLWYITETSPSLDTHTIGQIFNQIFLIDKDGNHPGPFTLITEDDIKNGKWDVNPGMMYLFKDAKNPYAYVRAYLRHYVSALKAGDRYDLTIWPFHTMLGGLGHILAPVIEEATFFHAVARQSEVDYRTKGGKVLTENYSVLGPEVVTDHNNKGIAQKNLDFINKLLNFDAIVIAGQAKSHCVAWTIADLLNEILTRDPMLAKKVYLLEDCTSPVVIPGIRDYTQDANDAFQKFADAGMNVVKSTDPIETWPGLDLLAA